MIRKERIQIKKFCLIALKIISRLINIFVIIQFSKDNLTKITLMSDEITNFKEIDEISKILYINS
jgi:hypothetical protein